MQSSRRATALALLSAAIALAATAPAGAATTYEVSGQQTVVDEQAGKYKMAGGLLGDFANTSFKEIAKAPIYRAKGTESFSGCLDRGRDGSCAGDPSGTLRFSFLYWGQFGAGDPPALIWGSCWHPIVGGTGSFKGAKGVLVMADTPTRSGVKTAYIGNVTLKGSSAARAGASARAAATRGCGATR